MTRFRSVLSTGLSMLLFVQTCGAAPFRTLSHRAPAIPRFEQEALAGAAREVLHSILPKNHVSQRAQEGAAALGVGVSHQRINEAIQSWIEMGEVLEATITNDLSVETPPGQEDGVLAQALRIAIDRERREFAPPNVAEKLSGVHFKAVGLPVDGNDPFVHMDAFNGAASPDSFVLGHGGRGGRNWFVAQPGNRDFRIKTVLNRLLNALWKRFTGGRPTAYGSRPMLIRLLALYHLSANDDPRREVLGSLIQVWVFHEARHAREKMNGNVDWEDPAEQEWFISMLKAVYAIQAADEDLQSGGYALLAGFGYEPITRITVIKSAESQLLIAYSLDGAEPITIEIRKLLPVSGIRDKRTYEVIRKTPTTTSVAKCETVSQLRDRAGKAFKGDSIPSGPLPVVLQAAERKLRDILATRPDYQGWDPQFRRGPRALELRFRETDDFFAVMLSEDGHQVNFIEGRGNRSTNGGLLLTDLEGSLERSWNDFEKWRLSSSKKNIEARNQRRLLWEQLQANIRTYNIPARIRSDPDGGEEIDFGSGRILRITPDYFRIDFVSAPPAADTSASLTIRPDIVEYLRARPAFSVSSEPKAFGPELMAVGWYSPTSEPVFIPTSWVLGFVEARTPHRKLPWKIVTDYEAEGMAGLQLLAGKVGSLSAPEPPAASGPRTGAFLLEWSVWCFSAALIGLIALLPEGRQAIASFLSLPQWQPAWLAAYLGLAVSQVSPAFLQAA